MASPQLAGSTTHGGVGISDWPLVCKQVIFFEGFEALRSLVKRGRKAIGRGSGRRGVVDDGTDTSPLVAVVFAVADLDSAAQLYKDAFGLELRFVDHDDQDRWSGGRHAVATSQTNGGLMHFALRESTDGHRTKGAHIAFRVADIDEAHRRAISAGAEVIHKPSPQPGGRSARYEDHDGNVVELTESD